MTERFDRRDAFWAGAIALAFGLFAILGITQLPGSIFDEVYTLPAARSIAAGEAPFEQTHPPLTKLLMALGFMAVRGVTGADGWDAVALGARLAAVVAGCACLVALYLLVRAMAGSRLPAIAATLLLALDGVFYLLSRLAMTNVFAAAFIMGGVLFSWLAVSRGRAAWLWPAGVAFGLAVACRHTAAIPLAICLALALTQLPGRVRTLAALGLLPVAVYALSYGQTLWVVTHGHPLSADGLATFVQLQRYSLASHSGYSVPNVNASPWWSWPWMVTPPWFSIGMSNRQDTVSPVLALGNALVWWAAVPAMAYAAWQGWRGRNLALGLLAALAIAPWLAWAPLRSNASLMHYFFESIPPVCAILGLVMARWRPTYVFGYLGLALAWTVFFHPLQAGLPIPLASYAWRLPATWELGQRVAAFRVRMHLEDPKAYAEFNRQNYPSLDEYVKKLSSPSPRPSGPS